MGLGAYQDVVDMMEKNDNMFADISYLAHWASVEKRHIRRDLPATEFPYFRWLRPILYASSSVLTADKLLFGSDWPMVNPRIGVEALRNITTMLKEYGLPLIPRATIENILGRNWRQVYRL
jgi:predicted TIM-barrel fold metal-dependent hydrolase